MLKSNTRSELRADEEDGDTGRSGITQVGPHRGGEEARRYLRIKGTSKRYNILYIFGSSRKMEKERRKGKNKGKELRGGEGEKKDCGGAKM